MKDLLREKYGFKGIIVSDCLRMVGAGNGSLLDKTEQALSFGDLAIICHKTPQEIVPILNSLDKKGYALSEDGQKRFFFWTDVERPASRS